MEHNVLQTSNLFFLFGNPPYLKVGKTLQTILTSDTQA